MTAGPVGEPFWTAARPEIPRTRNALPAVFDAIAVGVLVHDVDGTIVAGNAEAHTLLAGIPTSVLSNAVAEVAAHGTTRSFAVNTPRPDGTPRRLLVTAVPHAAAPPDQPGSVVTTVRDLAPVSGMPTNRAPRPRIPGDDHIDNGSQLPNIRDLAERRLAATTDASPIGSVLINADGTILRANRAFLRMAGHPAAAPDDALAGVDLGALVSPPGRSSHKDLLTRLTTGSIGSYEVEVRLLRPDSAPTWVRLSAAPIADEAGRVLHVAVQAQDVTEARKVLTRLTHQAVHDPLTGLPNRTSCGDHIRQALLRGERRNRRIAVLVCGLDNFRVVNDSMGPAEGDRVLITVAQRLREALHEDVFLSRFSGDEFLVAAEVSDTADALALARHLIGTVARSVELSGRSVVPSVSVGLALSELGSNHRVGESGCQDVNFIPQQGSAASAPPASDPAWRLAQDAGAALHQAKQRGRGSIVVSDSELRASTHERLELEGQLRSGVRSGQMRLHLQNIVDLRDGTIVGREALVRWQHPERGLLAPGVFLPMAEESGLIQDLGRWVIGEAARIAVGTPGPGYVAINISPSQVRHPGLVDQIEQALQSTGLPPERLVVELTESVVLEAAYQARDQLELIDRLGVRVMVDDFGTGYSALSHLRDLPVSGIKIDRSFTQGLGIDRHCDRIVEALTGLAGGLGVDLVAEGVETEQQAVMLNDIGCQHAQGYLFGKPHPAHLPLP